MANAITNMAPPRPAFSRYPDFYMQMFQQFSSYITGLLLILCLIGGSHADVAEVQTDVMPDIGKQLEMLGAQFEKARGEDKLGNDLLDALGKQLTRMQVELEACIAQKQEAQKTVEKNLQSLGEVTEGADPEVVEKRQEIAAAKTAIEKDLGLCRVNELQLEKLQEQIRQTQQTLIKNQLLTPYRSIIKMLQDSLKGDSAKERLAIVDLLERIRMWGHFWPVVILFVFGALAGMSWKRFGADFKLGDSSYAPTFLSALRGIRRYSPAALGLFLAWVYMLASLDTSPQIHKAVSFTLLLILIHAAVRGVIRNKHQVLDHRTLTSRTVNWVFLLSTGLTYLFSQEGFGDLPESNLFAFVWYSGVGLAVVSFTLVYFVSVHRLQGFKHVSIIFLLPLGFALAALLSALAGYRNLSSFLLFGMIKSLMVMMVAWLLMRISSEFFDSLDEAKTPRFRHLRTLLNIEENRPFPGVIWLRLLLTLIFLFIAGIMLLWIWGASRDDLTQLVFSLRQGFSIGDVHFDPLRILYALAVVALLLSLIPLIKHLFLGNLLRHSSMSQGAKDATQTLSGYVFFIIAAIIGLSVAGVNFQSIAIVAGALSVGIGFGLQNIVNNFVSGIILLFERPIRRGDWIQVGATEGFVRDISIRSTVIRTFLNADVIVPNSDMISNQVTNWMLNDTIGKMRVPVGVAYGSDTQLVIDILEEIANNHPAVIKDHPKFPIRVFFLRFGDSSLDFELDCFLRNVDSRRVVTSDVNLAIDRAFRKHNIEIPFPQRVIHMAKQEADKQADKETEDEDVIDKD